MSDGFLRQARINFCCLVQAGKDPDAFAKRLCDLGKYHKVECEGATKNPLTCPLHALAYEIECNIRAARAHNVIHPELGKGHSNLCEGSHKCVDKI